MIISCLWQYNHMAPMWLYAKLGHASAEIMDDVWRNTLSDEDQSITELLNSLRSDLVAPDRPKHNVPEVFYWVWVRWMWGQSMLSIPTSSRNFLHNQATCLKLGIVVHKEEPNLCGNDVAHSMIFSAASPDPFTVCHMLWLNLLSSMKNPPTLVVYG